MSKRVLAVDGAYLGDNPCRRGKAACFHYLNINELFTISNERMQFSTKITARMKFRPSVNAGEVNRARALNMEVFA